MAEPLELNPEDIGDDYPELGAPPEPVTITPPKIIEGLPGEEYHADLTSVGVGGLRLVGRSPLHHWYFTRRPDREPEEPTDSQLLGTAAHMAVLEPERFQRHYLAAPKVDRRTREGKETYAAYRQALEASGATEISADHHAAALRIAESVHLHPVGARLLGGSGRAELSVYWTDRDTGVRCRMRPDFVPDGEALLVDLKSCTDAAEGAFTRTAWNFGYQLTAAWYVDGWRAATGEKREYVFCAWEKDEPHAAAFYYAEDDTLQAGRDAYRKLLRVYADCLERDEWPGYPAQLMPFYPPSWAI